jgi:plastocyanin
VKRHVTPLLLGSAVALVAAAPAAAAEVQVQGLDSLAWDKPKISIAAGDKVMWAFQPNELHNVVSTSPNWSHRSTTGKPAPPTEFTFTAEGLYTYYCEIHKDSMLGEITVGNPPPPPPPPLSEQPFPNDSAITTGAFEIGSLDTAKPRLRGVTAKKSGKRVKVSFKVNEQSVVTVRFARRGKTVMTKRASVASRGSVTVAGLKAGRYAVAVSATDVAGNASSARRASFRIR